MPRPSYKVFKKRKHIGKPKSVGDCSTSPRPTNSTTVPRPSPKISTESSSRKKIARQQSQYNVFSKTDKSDTYDIVKLKEIEEMLANIAVCKECSGKLSISTDQRLGLSVVIGFNCNNCGLKISKRNDNELNTSESNSKSELNVRLVYAFRSIGKGENAAKTLCGVLNLPSPPLFRYYSKYLCSAAREVCMDSMKEAVAEAVEQNDGNRDIAAAFDGTWQRRGFSSQNGVTTVTSVSTGMVLDVKILSKYCRCENKFENVHTEECIANYKGTSGGMEVDGIVDFFRRSQSLHNIRYKYFLGDGDSSAFPTIASLQPYGSDFEVKKLECVGHVQKRMGRRLRDLIPKRTFVNLTTLEFGVYEAITSFNKGHITKCLILSKLGIKPGVNCVQAMQKFDSMRVYKADKALDEIQKKCRQKATLAKRKLEDMFEETEDPDEPAYGAGLY